MPRWWPTAAQPQVGDDAGSSAVGHRDAASPEPAPTTDAPAGDTGEAWIGAGTPASAPQAPVLAIANQKGGVGKTTTAVSLAAALAESRRRVTLVDLDPQANATSGLGRRGMATAGTLYDVLMRDVPVRDVLLSTDLAGLDVVPAGIDLAGAEVELVSTFNREQRLRTALEPLRAHTDLLIVDCPPSLGLLTINALAAADAVLVPIQSEYYALEGLEALHRNIDLVRGHLNPDLAVLGFVLTMTDPRTRLSQQVMDEVRSHFGEAVFATQIPRSVRLAEAPGFGRPITAFDPGSRGAMAYRRLADEVQSRLPSPAGAPPTHRR